MKELNRQPQQHQQQFNSIHTNYSYAAYTKTVSTNHWVCSTKCQVSVRFSILYSSVSHWDASTRSIPHSDIRIKPFFVHLPKIQCENIWNFQNGAMFQNDLRKMFTALGLTCEIDEFEWKIYVPVIIGIQFTQSTQVNAQHCYCDGWIYTIRKELAGWLIGCFRVDVCVQIMYYRLDFECTCVCACVCFFIEWIVPWDGLN